MKRKIDGTKIVFTFDNLDAITFDATRASDKCANHAEMHGWNVRIGDGAALSRKQKDGSVIVITEQMRRDEILRLVEHYESGTADWELGRSAAKNPQIAAAAKKAGMTYEEAAQKLGQAEVDKLAEFLKSV